MFCIANKSTITGEKMKKLMLALLVASLLTACSKPTDIVLGPEPLKQMAEQGERFKKLPEDDRMLLAGYIGLVNLGQQFGSKDIKPLTGRTVGEVLVDAKAWRAKVQTEEALKQKRDAEATVLRDKVNAEQKALMDQLSQTLTVAVTRKGISPKDYSISRLYDQLSLTYAVENKSDKAIRQIKGYLYVFDATGDKLGMLPITFDETISPKSTLKTTTGGGWKIQRFENGDIEKIADTPFEGMTTRFDIKAIAYVDGQVVKAP